MGCTLRLNINYPEFRRYHHKVNMSNEKLVCFSFFDIQFQKLVCFSIFIFKG